MKDDLLRIQIAVIILARLILASPVHAITAEDVVRTMGPSVVLIESISSVGMESFGSGVVLDESGTILTCFHVISHGPTDVDLGNTGIENGLKGVLLRVRSPLPLHVTAEVDLNGKREQRVFDHVKVKAVHPEYDLALLEVEDTRGAKFLPASKAQPRTVEAGEVCFAIGNPGAGGAVLAHTITEGVISSGARMIDGKAYIQVSAQVNPGNSGGALYDRSGKLIGIVTLKISHAEGLAFAIPSLGLKMSEFKTVQDRMTNVDEAVIFYEKALDMDSRHVLSVQDLDISAGELWRNKEKVAEFWYKGMRPGRKNDKAVACCALNYGQTVMSKEGNRNHAAAAYCIKWGLEGGAGDKIDVQQIYDEAVKKLTDQQFQILANKTTNDFSRDDLTTFIEHSVIAPTAATNNDLTASSSPATQTNAQSLTTDFPDYRLNNADVLRFLKDAPDPGPNGLTKTIPDKLIDAQPAMGGAYLVLKFKTLKKLGVFNVAQAKFDSYIPTADLESVYGAGGRLLIIYSPSQNVFHKWDLGAMKQTETRTNRISGIPTHIAMGLQNPTQALISYVDSRNESATRRYILLNIDTFDIRAFRNPADFQYRECRDLIQLRPNDQLTAFIAWRTSSFPQGFTYATIGTTSLAQITHNWSCSESLALSSDSTKVFGSSGKIMDKTGKVLQDFSKAEFFPVFGTNCFIQIDEERKLAVRRDNDGAAIARFALPFSFSTRDGDPVAPDRRVIASAQLNRVAFIDNTNSEISVLNLGLSSQVRTISARSGPTNKGTLWYKKLSVSPDSKISIEGGPFGIEYHTSTQLLTWQVPSTQSSGTVEFQIAIDGPGATNSHEKITIAIR